MFRKLSGWRSFLARILVSLAILSCIFGALATQPKNAGAYPGSIMQSLPFYAQYNWEAEVNYTIYSMRAGYVKIWFRSFDGYWYSVASNQTYNYTGQSQTYHFSSWIGAQWKPDHCDFINWDGGIGASGRIADLGAHP